MKKVIVFVLILIGIPMISCDGTTTEQTTTTQKQTTTTVTTFEAVDTAMVESDLAVFNVGIDTNEINELNPVVTVVVEITAKTTIDQELGTSSYGDEGIIGIRIVSSDDDETMLYSEFYDIPVTEDIHDVHLDANDSLTRTMQFARMPFHGGAGGEEPSPIGVYEVQVALYSYEMVWIDTGLSITVDE